MVVLLLLQGESLCKDGVYVSKKEKAKALSKAGMVIPAPLIIFPHMSIRKNHYVCPTFKQARYKRGNIKIS